MSTTPATDWPTQEEALKLHADLQSGDRVASSKIAVAYTALLCRELERSHPAVDPHVAQAAADDAILNLVLRPETYDPERQMSLKGYLVMSAKGDLHNALQKLKRHTENRSDFDVEHLDSGGNEEAQASEIAWDDPEVRFALATLDDTETRVLDLMRDGVRDTATFAVILGCASSPVEEQSRLVKNAKDRIRKRLERRLRPDE